MQFLQDLRARGLLKQITNETKLLNAQKEQAGVYLGIDPTATSLHVGHILQIVLLYRFLDAGFKPIAIVGKGTGMIGDPSFKATERKLLDEKTIDRNSKAISKQLKSLLNNQIKIVNNFDWLSKLSLLEYLRDIGKDFNVNYMLDKESIHTRLETGISYTEFSYMILQAYDFLHLYQNFKCWVQIGGSDQWGNITAGVDFIRKKVGDNNQACGLTIELLTQRSGVKFGKTEQGTVWLDRNLTSPYLLYQFFVSQDDEDLERFLKWLTLLSIEEIDTIIKEHFKNPALRSGQKKLASEIVTFVHSQKDTDNAIIISNALFSRQAVMLSEEQLLEMKGSIGWLEVTSNLTIKDALIALRIATSNKRVRELIKGNAIYINEQLITDENYLLTKDIALHQSIIIIRKGKSSYYVIQFKK